MCSNKIENHICFCYRFATWLLANLIEGAFMKQLCRIKEDFTAVPNLILLDKNLNEKEKILYLYLLSKQTRTDNKTKCITVNKNNWIFYSDKVAKELNIDFKTLKNRLASLESKKYIKCVYDETGKIFGKPKGFKVSLSYQDSEYKRTGESKQKKEKLLNEDIKKLYRANCEKLHIRKKTLKYPNERQWNMIFEIMGNYKYLIPYVPYCFSYCFEYYPDEKDFPTLHWIFTQAFENSNDLIDFLLRAKAKHEIIMKYEKAIENNKEYPDIVEVLKQAMKDDLERYESFEKLANQIGNYLIGNKNGFVADLIEETNSESID